MKVRTVLYADEGTVLTNGTDYGTIIWLAEDVSPDSYYPIPVAEYEAIMAEQNETII
jgi:hypothetical protein